MKYTTVIPAGGRDYTSAKAARADWNAGKDFILADATRRWDRKPTSKRDWEGVTVMIRFNQLTKIAKA